jgi:hypothetical protein
VLSSAGCRIPVRDLSAVTIGRARHGLDVPVERVGSRVRSRFAGRVHSVFRRACNIETDDGPLVTVLAQGQGNLPHGIRSALPEAADFRALLSVGYAVVADGVCVRIPQAGITMDLSGASVWHCGLAAGIVDLDSDETLSALLLVRAILEKQAPPSGFAPLLLRDEDPDSLLDRAMQKRLRHTLPLLEAATVSLNPANAAQALAELIGLGSGLTPSGDDFIVGYLAALFSRHSRAQVLQPFLAALSDTLARLVASGNLISRQFILDALEGEFSESLAELVSAISARDGARLRASAAQLVRIGHSSGADSLTGLLFGLRPSLVLGHEPESGRAHAVFANPLEHAAVAPH